MTTVERWISHWARQAPDKTALLFNGEAVAYTELSGRVKSLAAAFAGHGIRPGDRVAILSLNRPEFIEALGACARLGAVLVPLNNRLTAAEHAFQIEDSDPSLLVAGDGFQGRMRTVGSGRPILDLDTVESDAAAPKRAAITGDDPILMVYTSGTTGQPKAAVHTHSSILFAILNGVAQQDLHATDRILASLPLFHVGGLNIQTLPALYVGGTVILQPKFDPTEALALIQDQRATQSLAVPATMQALLDHPDFDSTDLSSMRGLNTGSSVVPTDLIQRFLDRGIAVGQVYGATETGPTAIVLRYEDAASNIGACGKAAIHTEVKIVGPDGNDVDRGEPGEVWLKGPNLFSGYWNRPDATASAFHDGWYRTGDVGRCDGRGFIYIEDRMKDMLISGGENVYPAEVETVLSGHPGIAEVAVVGRPDERWGEVPVAVIVPVNRAEPPTVDDLVSWCEHRLARYKQPREVHILDTLPRTALGKVTKHVLRTNLFDGAQDPTE